MPVSSFNADPKKLNWTYILNLVSIELNLSIDWSSLKGLFEVNYSNTTTDTDFNWAQIRSKISLAFPSLTSLELDELILKLKFYVSNWSSYQSDSLDWSKLIDLSKQNVTGIDLNTFYTDLKRCYDSVALMKKLVKTAGSTYSGFWKDVTDDLEAFASFNPNIDWTHICAVLTSSADIDQPNWSDIENAVANDFLI